MLKRIVLLVILSVMSLAPATARADGESAPAGTPAFKQELIPAEPLSNQHLLESVWVLIIFGLMVVVLYPTAWKQVLAGLKSREEHIRKNIADAETARINAEKSLANYNAQLAGGEQKVRDLLTQAASDAEKIATTIRMKAQQEAEEAKDRATKDIEAAKQAALTEIYTQTADLATSIAEKIIRRSLNANDQRDLVDQSLEQLKSARRN